jgi:hypothetical protein
MKLTLQFQRELFVLYPLTKKDLRANNYYAYIKNAFTNQYPYNPNFFFLLIHTQ